MDVPATVPPRGPDPSGPLSQMRGHPQRVAEDQKATRDVAVESGSHGEDVILAGPGSRRHTPRGELAHTGGLNASSIGVPATLAA